jgi:hypothetical protein
MAETKADAERLNKYRDVLLTSMSRTLEVTDG